MANGSGAPTPPPRGASAAWWAAGGAVGGALAALCATRAYAAYRLRTGPAGGGGGGAAVACGSCGSRAQGAEGDEGRRLGAALALEDDVVSEQLTRNRQFFGDDGQTVLSESFAVVVGCGGVGSHAAAMLLRAGVGRLRLVDFDQVTLSSLNRHAVATREDVGTPKVAAMRRRFAEILPETPVEACVRMYDDDGEDALLGGEPDIVLDCIDNIDTKVALLAACKRRGLKVLCSAGAGAKADPTRLRIADICECSSDPLAKSVRYRLKDRGIERGVPVLFSTEKQRCELVPCEGDNLSDYQVVPNFRVRTIPVLGTSPAAFGVAMAGWAITQLAGQPFSPEPVFALRPRELSILHENLVEREDARGAGADVRVDLDDVDYVVRDLWWSQSARVTAPAPGKGLWRDTRRLTLTRWDAAGPARADNLVLLTHAEADEHDERGVAHARAADPEFARRVDSVMARARRERGYAPW